MAAISRVEIFLDDYVPEYMDGIIRIGSVNYEFEGEDGSKVELPDLVDNAEFHSEDELISYVAKKLNISGGVIEIIE